MTRWTTSNSALLKPKGCLGTTNISILNVVNTYLLSFTYPSVWPSIVVPEIRIYTFCSNTKFKNKVRNKNTIKTREIEWGKNLSNFHVKTVKNFSTRMVAWIYYETFRCGLLVARGRWCRAQIQILVVSVGFPRNKHQRRFQKILNCNFSQTMRPV